MRRLFRSRRSRSSGLLRRSYAVVRDAGLSSSVWQLSSLTILVAVGGCVSDMESSLSVPRPNAALMAREAPPKCIYAEPAVSPGNAPVVTSATGQGSAERIISELTESGTLQRREHERDCFRDAEFRVRAKLTRLQSSVRGTLQAVDAFNASVR